MGQAQAHQVAEDDREDQVQRDQRAAEEEDQYDQHGHGHVDADPKGIALVDGIQVADARRDADEVELHVVPGGIRLALLLLQPVVDGPQQSHALLREGIVIADQIEARDFARVLAAGEKELAALLQDRLALGELAVTPSCSVPEVQFLPGQRFAQRIGQAADFADGLGLLALAVDVDEIVSSSVSVARSWPTVPGCRSCRRRRLARIVMGPVLPMRKFFSSSRVPCTLSRLGLSSASMS